jgi:transcription initiation factor TFIIIB Brf1 subunit/transcription initiation factor TFIIB
MHDSDEWGKDPSVRIMRTVFKEMEKAQQALLSRLDISSYDLRIRKWRETSLALFEQAWGVANRTGISMDATMASAVYVHCLAKTIGSEGNEIPEGIVPEGKEIERLLKEMLQ